MLKAVLLMSFMTLGGCATGPQQNLKARDISHNEIKSSEINSTEMESTAGLKGKQVLLGGIVLSEPVYTQKGKYFFKVSSVALDDQYKPVRKRKVAEAPIFEVLIDEIPQPEKLSAGSEVTVLGVISESKEGYKLDSKEFYLWTRNPVYKKVFMTKNDQLMASDADWLWYCNRCDRIQPSLVQKQRRHSSANPDRANLGRSAYKNPYKGL